MGYEKREVPPVYRRLSQEARQVFLDYEETDPALARAQALAHVVGTCPVTLERDSPLAGGEDPFFFNLMLDTLWADRYARTLSLIADPEVDKLRQSSVFMGPCFEGHITPGLEYVLGQGIDGLRRRLQEHLDNLSFIDPGDQERRQWYQAALLACENVLTYARRYREEALRLAAQTGDAEWAKELREAAERLARVPEHPAQTFPEALQAYWLVYVLVTLEVGGCVPGGGLGLGRMDQYLYPTYQRDVAQGRLTRAQALEWMELFLLGFRHVDYYTPHQVYTPGSQASLGGVTPTGLDASNELTELIMEASLRIAMPAPYVSLRLHQEAPERYWEAAASYVIGGLGFPVVNDEVLIPAFMRHGRSLADARDYICSCCYENTIPGREAFHPNGIYLNLPYVLELALNKGRSLLTGQALGADTGPAEEYACFEEVWAAFCRQLGFVVDRVVGLVNRADEAHSAYRRYPLMSLFFEDCIARGQDVCAGGARYNLTGCIVAGLPNVVNALAAIRHCVYEQRTVTMRDLLAALRADFDQYEDVHRRLLAAPKWGNGDRASTI